jgi:diacylglycerol kinase family enzyme
VNDRVLAIINGRAGGATDEQQRDELTALLTGIFEDAEIVFTDEGTNVEELARGAVARGARMIVAGGGDGTINAIVSALAGSTTVLGLLPLGTLNHFAKDLHIPGSPAEAALVLAAGHLAHVDVGEVNGRVFVNNSGLGLYPATVILRDYRQRGGYRKWPAFAWAAMKALGRFRYLRIRVTTAEGEMIRRTPIVFVGNNRYEMEGLRAGKRDAIDRGELCLYIPRPRGRWHLIWFSILALLGRAWERDDFDYVFTDTITIESRHEHLRVSLDGEVAKLATPLAYRIRRGALRVVVPAPPPAVAAPAAA